VNIPFPMKKSFLNLLLSRGLLAVFCFLFAMSASWFWAIEVWQRPDSMLHWDERLMLVAALVGFSTGSVLLLIAGHAARLRHALIVTTFCGLAFAGICVTAHTSAVKGLLRHRDLVPSSHDLRVLDALNTHDEEFPEKWINEFLSRFRYQDEPLDHLLEASRWRVRKAFLQEIITDEKHVGLVARNWQRLFPAVIGQDVTLARRHELMRRLDTLAKEESAAASIRNAAVFWMGLIVLTDTKLFAAERTRVRDMMLASDDPPMNLTGDVWMRVLNALVAFDAPEKIAPLSIGLTRDRILLRRAVREGLRGIETQAEAVIHEIEMLDAGGERTAAAALWLDLRLLIARADGQSVHTDTRHWLLETLVKWLMEDSASVRERFAPDLHMNGGGHRTKATDFVMEMPEQTRAKLAAQAMRVLESAPEKPEIAGSGHPAYSPVEVEHALMMLNFLDAGNRQMVSDRVASVILNHMHFVNDQWENIHRPLVAMDLMVWVFLKTKEDLGDQYDEQITRIFFDEGVLKERFRGFNRVRGAYHLSCVIDEKSPSPRISGAERLAILAIHSWLNDSGVSRWWGVVIARETRTFTAEEVNEFLNAFLKAANSSEKSFQVSPKPDGLWFEKDRVRNALRFSTWTDLYDGDDRIRDLIRLRLIRQRVLGYEHLPANWPEFFHAEQSVHGNHWDFPDDAYWAPLMETPSDTQAMLDHFDVPNDYVLRGLIGYLEHNPPKPVIKAVILKHFESLLSSDVRSQRITAYRVLLKLSPWLEPDDLIEFRSRLYGFFNKDRPAPNEWTHTMMLPMDPQHDYPRQYAISGDQCRSEWIKWADDELSALLSWSSQIHHELSMLPHDWRLFPDRGLFMYLNTYLDACDACPWTGLRCEPAGLDVALSGRYRRGLPPDVPFEATPWQRARELHLRRTDLDFADRALFRPDIHRR